MSRPLRIYYPNAWHQEKIEMAFENAIRLLMAIGGSPIAITHLQAIALELGLVIGLDTIRYLGTKGKPKVFEMKRRRYWIIC